MVQVTVDTFWKRLGEVPAKVTDKTGTEHNVRIVPAPFGVMWYINNTRYLPAHSTLEAQVFNEQKENNVQLL